jgi:hypothetical protein
MARCWSRNRQVWKNHVYIFFIKLKNIFKLIEEIILILDPTSRNRIKNVRIEHPPLRPIPAVVFDQTIGKFGH